MNLHRIFIILLIFSFNASSSLHIEYRQPVDFHRFGVLDKDRFNNSVQTISVPFRYVWNTTIKMKNLTYVMYGTALDVDMDNKLEYVLLLHNGSIFTISIENGSILYHSYQNFSVVDISCPHVFGDIDNDRHVELIFVSQTTIFVNDLIDGEIFNVTLQLDFDPYIVEIADVDDDSYEEILLIGSNDILAFDIFDNLTIWRHEYADYIKCFTLMDINNDAHKEIIVVYNKIEESGICILESGSGETIMKFEFQARMNDLYPLDVDQDGTFEFIVLLENKIAILTLNGDYLWSRNIDGHAGSLIAVADIDLDYNLDIIYTRHDVEYRGKYYCIVDSLSGEKIVEKQMVNYTILGLSDFNGDGRLEFLVDYHYTVGEGIYFIAYHYFGFIRPLRGKIYRKLYVYSHTDVLFPTFLYDVIDFNNRRPDPIFVSYGYLNNLVIIDGMGDKYIDMVTHPSNQSIPIIPIGGELEDFDGDLCPEIIYIWYNEKQIGISLLEKLNETISIDYFIGIKNRPLSPIYYWYLQKIYGVLSQRVIDKDLDLLQDDIESSIGTDPNDKDTDSDDILDGWEYLNFLDPCNDSDRNIDIDGDGLSNYDEYVYATDPRNTDTDGDGAWDGEEVESGTDPLDPKDNPKRRLMIKILITVIAAMFATVIIIMWLPPLKKVKSQ